MKFSEYPIVKLLFSIIIGILLARYISSEVFHWYILSALIFFFTLLTWPKKYFFSYQYRYIIGFIITSSFILLGFISYKYHFNFDNSHHFSRFQSKNQTALLRITEPPQQKENSVKLFVEVESISNDSAIVATIGDALIYLQKDSSALSLEYGDLIAFHNIIKPTEPPYNPDQFNYKLFLNTNGINNQAYARSDGWEIVSRAGFSFMGFALNLRKKLLIILQKNNVEKDELSVAAGMLLGVRDMLSPELRNAYAGAGAMHILCVSGLHVGIIFMILAYLFGFLDGTDKGKVVKSLIILLIIWFYAMLTGFSPSVVRSATMFSFIIIGQNLKRHVNIIGSLSSSAFVLLIIDPTLIFDLGFQLSYSAVTAIVILQPQIANLWIPSNKFIDKIWQLVAVSIAAQIGTAPISIFYFHQFPNYFILTNLIVIPAAYIIIMLGIIVAVFSFIPLISSFLGKILSLFISLVNFLISYIEQMDYAVSRDLYISPIILVLLILLVLSVSWWLVLKKKKLIFINLFLIILILVAWNFNYNNKNEFVVYKNSRDTYMAIYSNHQAWVFCDSATLENPEIASFNVEGHELKKGIRKHHYYLLDSKLKIHNKNFHIDFPFMKIGGKTLMFDSKNNTIKELDYYIYANKHINKSAKINDSMQCIIAANIPPWESKKLIPKLDSLKINYHQIKSDGAWILEF